jgi:uncharacterized protein YceH (UPF0502 family)
MDYRTLRSAPLGAPGGLDAASLDSILLDAEEARVLGCLIEKEMTTPEYYPLTLNSLVSACKQKSSRYPVVEYDGKQVQATLDRLKEMGLVNRITSSDSRVPRFRHLADDALRLNKERAAVLCVLMLRGPQTVGEIRQRTNRMYEFVSLSEVEDTLEELASRDKLKLVVQLPRQAGTKESRFCHLLMGEPDAAMLAGPAPTAPSASKAQLEGRVTELEARLGELEAQFERFKSQF